MNASIFKIIINIPKCIGTKISPFTFNYNSKISRKAATPAFSKVYNSVIGDYSYISRKCFINNSEIGKFCSVASGVYLGMPGHTIDCISTSPIFFSNKNCFKKSLGKIENIKQERTIVGNDVWIGTNVLVKAGVTIGTGAIIGAGAVVTKNIPPYEIWGGIPAKKIKDRFDEETKKRLLDSKWWDKNLEELANYSELFISPADFAKALE